MQEGKYSKQALQIEEQEPQTGKYSSQALAVEPKENKEPFSTIFNKPSKDIGLWESFKEVLSGDLRETETSKNLPEVGKFEGFGGSKDLKIAAGLLATQDQDEQMQIIQKVAPETTFSEDEKGNIIGDFNGKQFVLNQPGVSFQDIISTIALIGAFGTTAPAKTVGTTLTKNMAAGAVSGAGTSFAIDKGAEALGAEQSGADQATRAIVAGAIEGAVPVAGSVFNAGKRVLTGTKKAPADALPQNSALIDQAEEAAAATGVDLFPAQKSLVPSELETQSFVAMLPGGAQNAFIALQGQNKQVAAATERFLKSIADDGVIPSAPAKFKEASEKAIDAVKTIRKENASPLYNEAFESMEPISTKIVTDLLDDKLKSAPKGGEIHRSLLRVKKFLGSDELDLRTLHNVKLEIDQMIAKRGESSLGNTTKKEVLEVQQVLLEVMDDASPAYKNARETFEASSPAVTELKEGVLGKVVNVKDSNLKQITSIVFDSAETSPSVVQKTRATIDAVDPKVYDNLMRVELEKRLGNMPMTLNAIENLPGQLKRAIFGNVKKRRLFLAALRPKQRQNAVYLETALHRASLGRPGGSQTANREEIKKEFSRGVAGALRAFLKTDVTKPLELIGRAGEDAAVQNKIKAISELMYNPKYTSTLKGIRELEKKDKAGAYTKMEALLEGLATAKDRVPVVTERQVDQSS